MPACQTDSRGGNKQASSEKFLQSFSVHDGLSPLLPLPVGDPKTRNSCAVSEGGESVLFNAGFQNSPCNFLTGQSQIGHVNKNTFR